MSIPWILFAAAVCVSLQMYVYSRWGLKGVRYSRWFDTERCTEGDTVHLVEKVSNRKILPVPWLRLEAQIHAGLRFQHAEDTDISEGERYQNHKSLFSLPPFTRITRRHRVCCSQRGCYRLKSAYMTCGDLFGLIRRAVPIRTDIELLVHPRAVPLEKVPLPSHSWQGDVTVKRWIVDDPFMIAGVREYRSGDSFRRIHWKATARSGKMQVHQNDYTADHRLMIYLNFEIDEKMWKAVTDPERIEKGIRYAAAIARSAISRGMEVGFGCNGRTLDEDPTRSLRIRPRGGKGHLRELLDAMAKLTIERTVPFGTFLDEDIKAKCRDLDYVLITSHEGRSVTERVRQLKKNGNDVTIVPLAPDSGKPGRERYA